MTAIITNLATAYKYQDKSLGDLKSDLAEMQEELELIEEYRNFGYIELSDPYGEELTWINAQYEDQLVAIKEVEHEIAERIAFVRSKLGM